MLNFNNKLLNEFLNILKRRQRFYIAIFSLSVVLCLCINFAYIYFCSPVYERWTMVKIEPLKSNNFVLFLGKGLSARNQTEVEIMTSRTMISKVVDALDSHITYSYRRNLRRESLSMPPFRLKSDVELPEMSLTVDILSDRNYSLIYDGDKYQGEFDKEHILPFGTIVLKKQNSIFENYNGDRIRLNITSKNKAIESLAANIHVEQAGTKSDLIYMVMTSENPFLADQHLYTLLNTYMDEGYVSKRNSLTQSREWIRQRLDTLSNDLSEIERDMNFYKQTNRTLNTNVETELFVRNAMYVEDELFENDANIRHVENLLTFFSENAHEWDEIPNNIKHNYISHQISRYNEALIQLKNTKNFVNSRNPVVQAEMQNVMSMRNSIENSITSYYESMLIKQNELLSRKITAENKIGGISSNIKNDVEMRRYRRVKRAVYRYLTKKYETTMIQLERIAPDARIIEPPTGSENYIWPRKKRLTAAALMIGFLLPCIPIVIQVIFSRKVRDKKDVVDIVSAPILGEIISKSKAQQGMELIVKEDSNDPVSESFRMIRSSLKFFNQGEFKVLSTSSTIPGEGKSYFAINIAMTLALSGKRVCMIDLDLRRRKMTVDMNMLKKQGVTEYLISKTDNINKLLYKTDVLDNLYIIPSGTIPPNPAELLAGNRFDVLMNELKEQFDYIITDNPPANIVADGKISNRHTDITCYVIRVGHLNREELPFVEEIYKEGQFRNFAVVLSDVPNMNKYEYKQQY